MRRTPVTKVDRPAGSVTSGIRVFISNRDSTCEECGENLGAGAWIVLNESRGATCLSCDDLDHLAFLPSGDAALTRRAGKHSALSAVVLKWSRARKRYERQGLLATPEAIWQAEQECAADGEVRSRRQEREAARRAELDQEYMRRFGERIRAVFPRCPPERERAISEHACLKYSGRVGRSAAAKCLDDNAVRLATIAHIRHTETNYDTLLSQGWDRRDARVQVDQRVQTVLTAWEQARK